MKKVLTWMLATALILVLTSSALASGAYVPGSYSAEADGIGKVTVTVTFDENSITDVQMDLSHETENIGSVIGEDMRSRILEAQSGDVDVVAQATVTSNAILTAVNSCIGQAKGNNMTSGEGKYAPGIYTMIEYGMGRIAVTYTFDENSITDVTLDLSEETPEIGQAIADKMRSDILAAQSDAIDTVTGATITSEAVKRTIGYAMARAQMKKNNQVIASNLKDHYDVVVVGAGAAGLMAAYELQTNHPDVDYIVLEKESYLGGAIDFSGGAISGLSSHRQMENGTTFTTDDIINLYTVSSDTTDINTTLLSNVFSSSGEMLTTLEEAGAPFSYEILSAAVYNDKVYTQWPMGLAYYGGRIQMGFLYKFFLERGVQIATNTEVADLDVEDGVVKGVILKDGRSITADAVLLATGGFGSNLELCKELIPQWTRGAAEAFHGATGDGLIWTRNHFNSKLVGSGAMGRMYTIDMYDPLAFDSRFMVAAEGVRFINETSPKYAITRYIADETEDAKAYMILDSNCKPEMIAERVAAGRIKPYDTLEALAEDYGIDAENLAASVARFNQMVENGVDEDFGVDLASTGKIETAPFYCDVIECNYFGTLPSPTVNNTLQVLDGEGNAVPGLFAAGELVIGNVATRQYPGMGQGISWAMNSGRFAAEQIALLLQK